MRQTRGGGVRDRGASLVELALILPVVALLVFGTVDLARAYRLQIRLENAAREGAAFGQVYPNQVDSCSTYGDSIADRVAIEDEDLPGHPGYAVAVYRADGLGDLTIQYGGCDVADVGPGDRIRVDVAATFDVLTPLVENIVGGSVAMTSSAQVEVQG